MATIPRTGWLAQTRRTYFGNAAAQRDFRVQLRGNRSMLLFGLYLAILIGVAYFKYADIARNATISVVDAQRQLRDFYTMIVFLLGGMVSIVTPGLAATSIVLERQRRSLDLVFSAPVAPRYYLVGKIIAVYRYTWMLLILSLPVTAACVVLGGASWGDVLTVYGLLSFHGLLFASIGLLVSTLSTKPVSAVVWTYAAVFGYLLASGSAATASSVMRSFGGRSGGEASFLIGMNPVSAMYAVGTYTRIGGVAVPNYVLAIAAILVAVRLCLLGAGSVLSEGRETANLRVHWAIVAAVAAFGLAYALVNSGGYSTLGSGVGSGGERQAMTLGLGLFWMLSPLVLALPTLAVYGWDGAGRQRPNGAFRFRHILDGTPAGALPYIVLLVGIAVLAGFAGLRAAGGALPSLVFVAYVVFTLGFWGVLWAIARAASSLGTGIRAARTSVVAAFVVLVVLPVPFLVAIAPDAYREPAFSLWNLYVLRPVFAFVSEDNAALAGGYGIVLLIVSWGVNLWAERKRARKAVAAV